MALMLALEKQSLLKVPFDLYIQLYLLKDLKFLTNLSSVDFPDPDGPKIDKNSPFFTSKLIFESISLSNFI